jgi:monoterpene epsilon-lactone hydrolase
MPVRLFLANQIVRYSMRRRFARQGDISPLRRMMAKMAEDVGPPPSHTRLETTSLGGVPGEKLTPTPSDERAAILYLHGGAFIAGAPRNHRALTWRLAHGTGVPVYAVDYRLAPEHPFPAGLDDCVTAYRALLDRGVERIAIAGDSAGGNLTLTTALDVLAAGLRAPVALACLSPVVTLSEELASSADNRDRDAMFPPDMLPGIVERYLGASDPASPRVSPLYSRDLARLPPTIFQCSENEILRDHSIEMSARLRAAGVTTELEVVPGAFHVWQLAADQVPESRKAIDRLVAFLRPRLR